ncbi:MAG: KEOPS complex subunit Pcc1 [Candidatus Thorarchaeota archaeon]|jgi:hypothetical protein
MMMTTEIKVTFSEEENAERTLKAISPDNKPVPSGLAIEARTNNKELVIKVLSQRGLDSLRATLEDLMSAIDLSLRTASTME